MKSETEITAEKGW